MNLATAVTLFSVLIPARVWIAPNQPIAVTPKAEGEISIVLTDFTGKTAEKGAVDVAAGKEFDVRALYPEVSRPGTWLLFAYPKGKTVAQFVGTPLVISTRADRRQANAPMVTKVEPLRYMTMETDHGPMTAIFYYDVAPHTVSSFQSLAETGFYNGLTFHRIVPQFVIQGGDPKGDGTGGPGYQIDAEFNDRRHEEGVLSMARSGDPLEAQGAMPRCEYANSAGGVVLVYVPASSEPADSPARVRPRGFSSDEEEVVPPPKTEYRSSLAATWPIHRIFFIDAVALFCSGHMSSLMMIVSTMMAQA